MLHLCDGVTTIPIRNFFRKQQRKDFYFSGTGLKLERSKKDAVVTVAFGLCQSQTSGVSPAEKQHCLERVSQMAVSRQEF